MLAFFLSEKYVLCGLVLRVSLVPEMAYSAGSLLVIFLGLSQLFICLNAVPTTRISRHDDVSKNIHLANANEMGMEVELVEGSRMDIEINDYPGVGANNRHTPKPPLRCGDC